MAPLGASAVRSGAQALRGVAAALEAKEQAHAAAMEAVQEEHAAAIEAKQAELEAAMRKKD